MNGFQRRTEQKKKSIRQAAAALFSRHGVDKVTMRDIADEARVSHVTIFRHFRSKQDLVLEVVRWLYDEEYREIETVLQSDAPYVDRMEQMLLFRGKLQDLERLDVIRAAGASDPDLLAMTIAEFETKANELRLKFFEEGKKKGYIDPEASLEALVFIGDGLQALLKLKPGEREKLKRDKSLLQGILRLMLFG